MSYTVKNFLVKLYLLAWGHGKYCKLGHDSEQDELFPKLVEILEDVYVVDVSCGMNHTLAVTNEGY